MLSSLKQAKRSTRPSLADKRFSMRVSRSARGGGIPGSRIHKTLLDNWITGTVLLLRSQSKVFAWQDCLAKRVFGPREDSRSARSSSNFRTNLLDNWNTGTQLSPLSSQSRVSWTICLARQRFAKRFACGLRVTTLRF